MTDINTKELLFKLTSAPGVSGAEENINNLLCELLKEYGEVYVDDMNSVFCTFGSGYHFLLDAHLDEIGMIVTSISDDGFVKVAKCGGIDARMLLSSEVSIWTANGEVKGVITTVPPHLQKDGDDSKVPEIGDVSIDVGMTKAEAEKLIALGDRVTVKRNFTELLGTQISASVLDDRSGVAAIILVLEELRDVNAKITVMFSSQEETGMTGAKVGPFGKNIDEAIAVDVSFGYSPLCKKTDCGEMGKGAMIGIAPILSNIMSQKLIETAKENDIAYQLEVMGGNRTGTNADAITLSESGIKTALISIPEKYMHSPIEVVDTKDVESVAKLIAAYIKKRVGEVNA
ncbi:MAG: M42 family metallopeptidase [Ruminococcaceae bacterium]|nr:M42 family metallopeptidase [Oscillospiraceae bacterium]